MSDCHKLNAWLSGCLPFRSKHSFRCVRSFSSYRNRKKWCQSETKRKLHKVELVFSHEEANFASYMSKLSHDTWGNWINHKWRLNTELNKTCLLNTPLLFFYCMRATWCLLHMHLNNQVTVESWFNCQANKKPGFHNCSRGLEKPGCAR